MARAAVNMAGESARVSRGVASDEQGRDPVVLVTEFPPDAAGGGAVILRSLLDDEERKFITWATMSPLTTPAGAEATTVSLPKSRDAGGLAREVERIAEREGSRGIWVVMHGRAVGVAAELCRSGKFPIHLTVHDDPAFGVALRSRRYLAVVPLIERRFAFALRHAYSIDVVSTGMAQRYRARYGVSSTVIHRAVAGPIVPAEEYDRRNGLSVGVLGNTYHYAAMRDLANAVATAAAELKVSACVVVIGRGFGERLAEEMRGRRGMEIEVAGHLDESEAIERLRRCFALYLNYPFGWRDRVLRRTSFPTKFSTYICAARPILVHAPPDSTISGLADAGNGYAHAWLSRDPRDGARRLRDLWTSSVAPERLAESAEGVRRQYFSPEQNRPAMRLILRSLCASARAELH